MKETNITLIEREVSQELENKITKDTLLKTTFKGFQLAIMKQAILEGMLRGFTFRDFLEKNIYAVPFAGSYSLITSIDYARKIGMKNGMCGKNSPVFEEKDGKIISCEVTVKRKISDYVGDYTAKVYFVEYNTGRNQWASKPRTMIAKVAEMHALRSAFPEDLSQIYTEEELEKTEVKTDNISDELLKSIKDTTTQQQLKEIWEKNKGLGKEFAKLVTEQKNFILSVNKEEKNGNS